MANWGGISESMARGYEIGRAGGGRLSGVGMALKVLLGTMVEDRQMRKKALFEQELEERGEEREFGRAKELLGMEEAMSGRLLEKEAGIEAPYKKGEEKRKYLLGVAQGELPLTAVPEEYRREVITGPKLDITGLRGTPETLAGVQRLPYTTEARGREEFMRRITPAETIPEAERRLREPYLEIKRKAEKVPTWKQEQTVSSIKAGLNRGEVVIGREFGEPSVYKINTIEDAYRAISDAGLNPSLFSEELKRYEEIVVEDRRGKRFLIPAWQEEEALKEGYRIVR